MPVWHELTKELRAAGDIKVIGITQEQHAERCQLWAQWQQIDWPILWDPFNLTGSAAVPIAMAVDESGVIRNLRLHPRKFEQQVKKEFLDMEFPAMIGGLEGGEPEPILPPLPWQEHLPALQKVVQEHPDDAGAWFRLGVALRMRFDHPAEAKADDFQRAIDCWRQALKLNPSQYIWRRRIQQWGPRLDKPYPFYDWVAQARSEIRARGETPIALPAPVFDAAQPSGEGSEAVAQGAYPDNASMIPRDEKQFIGIRHALVKHTQIPRANDQAPAWKQDVLRLHLLLQPDAKRKVHWGWEGGPCQIWLYDAEGWEIEQDYFRVEPQPTGDQAAAVELDGSVQGVNFEIRRSAEEAASELKGIAFYYICVGESGECTFLARDFSIPLESAD